MKYTYRKVKNASGNISVQVGYYKNRRFKLTKHIGSAKNEGELLSLIKEAVDIITSINLTSPQLQLFKHKEKDLLKEFLKNYKPQNITYKFALSEIEKYFNKIGYGEINSKLLKYLALIRLIKPASKKESLKLLEQYFGITYSESYLYKTFKTFQKHKGHIEKINTAFATNSLKQNLSILFYDVTTLYFESFTPDDLRSLGFSKENKFNQPQILIGLIVTDIGFPIAYHLYEGKKFEGKTMIPAIKSYIEKIGGKLATVVADAGMISEDNIDNLKRIDWKYIVGARISNLDSSLTQKIISHNFVENPYLELRTDLGRLIVEFSHNRYRKDEHELNEAIKKAEKILKNPSKLSSRYRFIKKSSQETYFLNEILIERRRELLGLKGYYTNTRYSVEKIVSEYKNLWRVEQNFRVFKGDLATRPIYHWKAENIQSHLLVSFIALSTSKLIEIETKSSLKSFVDKVVSVKDIEVLDLKSNKVFSVRI